MKIVCFHLNNDYSGSPTVLAMILEGLLNSGYSIDLITSRGGKGALDRLIGKKGIQITTFYYQFIPQKLILTLLNSVWAHTFMFVYSFKYVFKKDVVFYINTVLPRGAALAGYIMRKRIVYHYHENCFAKGIRYRMFAWIMTHVADDIICVSTYQASYLKGYNNITVVPNAIANEMLENLNPDIEAAFYRRNILMISSLRDYKGTKEFIQLANNMPDYSFTLVINDTMDHINSYVEERHIIISPNIQLFPRQPDVSSFYNKASIVVNLTNKNKAIETFGMTVLEAMSAGLPVIVPTVGGVTEMVNSNNGYKIDVCNLESIEEAIHCTLSNKALYITMAKNALNKSKEYSYSSMIKGVEKVLNNDR